MNITVIGTGFVGVVTAGVFAHFDNQVYALDIDQEKIDSLNRGEVPFFEPKLQELTQAGLDSKKLRFTTNYQESISDSQIIMISVGTPSAKDGTADLKFIKAASQSLAPYLQDGTIIALKSTVPPGTSQVVSDLISEHTDKKFHIVSLPEFLKEGSAVDDTMNPDRVVIGASNQAVIDTLLELHKPLGGDRIVVSAESAQMAKYSSNSYLAQRITFINQIANLCEKNGADVNQVIKVMGADKRIGSHYWYPGLGYGGSCFPKDVKELAAYARSVGEGDGLLVKIDELNDRRIPRLMQKYEEKVGGWDGKKVAVLGLSFKPNTDDMREAPSLKIIPIIEEKGASVVGFDPKAGHLAKKLLPKTNIVGSLDQAVEDADIVIALIEWQEIISKSPDYFKEKMKGDWFIDVRNQFSAEEIKEVGLKYIGIGIS